MLFLNAARASTRAIVGASARTQRLACARTTLAGATPTSTTTTYGTAPTPAQITISATTQRCYSLQPAEQPANGDDSYKNVPRPESVNDIQTHKIILWNPWTPAHLAPMTRAAYEYYGPGFLEHLNAKEANEVILQAKNRWRFEEHMKQRLGERWFEVRELAMPRWKEMEGPVLEEFRRRHAEITSMDIGQDEKQVLFRELKTERDKWDRDRNAQMALLEATILKELQEKSD